jgi:uncharacterized membrane protein
MNNSHTVIGLRWNGKAPFRWTEDAGVELLPVPSNSRSEVIAINDSGLIAGSVASGNAPFRAAAWLPAGIVNLPQLSGIQTTAARDVNNLGTVLVGAW